MFKSFWKGIIENYIEKEWNDHERFPVGRYVEESKTNKGRIWIPGQIEVFMIGQHHSDASVGSLGDVFIGEWVDISSDGYIVLRHKCDARNNCCENDKRNNAGEIISYIPWKDIRSIKFHFPPMIC